MRRMLSSISFCYRSIDYGLDRFHGLLPILPLLTGDLIIEGIADVILCWKVVVKGGIYEAIRSLGRVF